MLHESDIAKLLYGYYAAVNIFSSYKILDVLILENFSLKLLYYDDRQNVYCTLPFTMTHNKAIVLNNNTKENILITTTNLETPPKMLLFDHYVVEIFEGKLKVIIYKDVKKLQTFNFDHLRESVEHVIALKKQNAVILNAKNTGLHILLLKERPEMLCHSIFAQSIFFSFYTQLIYCYKSKKIIIADLFEKKSIIKEFNLSLEINSFSITDKNEKLLCALTFNHELYTYRLNDCAQLLHKMSLCDMIISREISIFASHLYIFLKDGYQNYYITDYKGRWIMVKRCMQKVVRSFAEVTDDALMIVEIIQQPNETRLALWTPCEGL